MSYCHFSKYERGQLQALFVEGFSHRIVALNLNCHYSSISHNSLEKYQVEKADENYHKRRAASKPVGKFSSEISKVIEEKMIATCSPEQIVNG